MSIRTFSFLAFVSALLFVFSTAGFCADNGSSEMTLRGLQMNEMNPVWIPVHSPVVLPIRLEPALNLESSRAPVSAPPVVLPARMSRPVQVIEAPHKVTLESLLRSDYRYRGLGTVSRFLELCTEAPPLFGEDQD